LSGDPNLNGPSGVRDGAAVVGAVIGEKSVDRYSVGSATSLHAFTAVALLARK
jgi:hypothetical protein